MNKLLAIDPGSNKLGLAIFVNGVLAETKTLVTREIDPLKRRLDMAVQLSEYVDKANKIASEEPLLLGRNNNGMQRLLGILEFVTAGDIQFVHPMTLKAFTGSGSNDKLDMALAVGERLSTFEQEILAEAITNEAWDETDAIAVGLWAINRENENASKIR